MSFYNNQPIPSLNAFIATIWVTTKRTVPSTTAHTVTSPHQDTLNVYVCPPSVIFTRIGDSPTNSVLVDIVTVAIPSDMYLMIVQLKTLPQNRQQPSLQEDRFNQEIITLLQQGSVHIKPGSQLYKGGNVTILFLSAALFLISSFCATSPIPGFLSYDYHHYLLILGPLTFTICTL